MLNPLSEGGAVWRRRVTTGVERRPEAIGSSDRDPGHDGPFCVHMTGLAQALPRTPVTPRPPKNFRRYLTLIDAVDTSIPCDSSSVDDGTDTLTHVQFRFRFQPPLMDYVASGPSDIHSDGVGWDGADTSSARDS
jgi:hypothetical protein